MNVKWNEKICIHAGECVKNLPNVFKVVDKKFVIDKSSATEDEIKRVENSEENNKESAYLIFDKISLNIPLSGIINISEELLKLNNNIDKLKKDLIKVNDKLKNKIFIKKAPKSVIENFHNQSKNIKSSIEKTKQIINSLK